MADVGVYRCLVILWTGPWRRADQRVMELHLETWQKSGGAVGAQVDLPSGALRRRCSLAPISSLMGNLSFSWNIRRQQSSRCRSVGGSVAALPSGWPEVPLQAEGPHAAPEAYARHLSSGRMARIPKAHRLGDMLVMGMSLLCVFTHG